MKKSFGLGFFVIFVLGILLVNICIADSPSDSLEKELEEGRADLEKGQEKIDEAKEKAENIKEGKWDYLSQEWKDIFLQEGKPFYYVNKFFEKFSFVFLIMLGEGYSFSILFFFMFFLWIYIFFQVFKTTRLFFEMDILIGIGLSFAITSLIGQSGALSIFIEFVGDFLATLTSIWFWIVLVIIIVLFSVFGRFLRKVGEAYQIQKEKAEKEQASRDRRRIHLFTNAITEGFKDVFKK